MSPTELRQGRVIFIGLRLKLLLVFSLLFMTTLGLVSWWFYNFATNLAMDNIRRDLISTAAAAAAAIDGDAHAALLNGGALDDANYRAISEQLREVKRTNPKASGMYTYYALPGETDRVHFLVSAALGPGEQPNPVDVQLANQRSDGCVVQAGERPALGAPYATADGMTPAMLQGLSEPSADPDATPDQWGRWISGFAPIVDSRGAIVGAVGVDMCAADVDRVQDSVRGTLFPVFTLVFLLLGIAIFILADRVTRPIVSLTSAADKIGQGDYEQSLARLHTGRVRDEVETLAHVFELMIDKVRSREERLKQQVAELQIIVDEGKRKQQVDEIVDSQFFRELQEKARRARARRGGEGGGETEGT
ncbi:MAG TPA: HAMP domain-containing protein [Herpetosiphonaceae bacterium]